MHSRFQRRLPALDGGLRIERKRLGIFLCIRQQDKSLLRRVDGLNGSQYALVFHSTAVSTMDTCGCDSTCPNDSSHSHQSNKEYCPPGLHPVYHLCLSPFDKPFRCPVSGCHLP